jgi:hypothetical protein
MSSTMYLVGDIVVLGGSTHQRLGGFRNRWRSQIQAQRQGDNLRVGYGLHKMIKQQNKH